MEVRRAFRDIAAALAAAVGVLALTAAAQAAGPFAQLMAQTHAVDAAAQHNNWRLAQHDADMLTAGWSHVRGRLTNGPVQQNDVQQFDQSLKWLLGAVKSRDANQTHLGATYLEGAIRPFMTHNYLR